MRQDGVAPYLDGVLVEGDVHLVAELLHLGPGQRLRAKVPAYVEGRGACLKDDWMRGDSLLKGAFLVRLLLYTVQQYCGRSSAAVRCLFFQTKSTLKYIRERVEAKRSRI